MTLLTFATPENYDLPVEVYGSDLRLVQRTLSSGSVKVGAGRYFLRAELPDGRLLRQSIVVKDEPSAQVELILSPAEIRGRTGDEGDLVDVTDPVVEWDTVSFLAWGLDESGHWREWGPYAVRASPGENLSVPAVFDAVGIAQPDGGRTIVRVPRDESSRFRFEVQFSRRGQGVELVARLINETADALLGYLSQDLLADASSMLESPELAEELLYYKRQDPIAAAVGGYTLLRLGELDRLHDWPANLANWFEWVPDGLVIRAEQLARMGDHDGAVESLRQLAERGPPVLSLGLSYATDRLRTYSAHWPTDDDLRRILVGLTRYAVATDFAAPITTFNGEAPDAPVPQHQPAPEVRIGRREPQRHEGADRVGVDDVLAVVEQLATDAAMYNRFQVDPQGLLREHGIAVPDDFAAGQAIPPQAYYYELLGMFPRGLGVDVSRREMTSWLLRSEAQGKPHSEGHEA